jgi:8-oxo-dGTP pyrophosphatase MutT (NUDIX family)
MKKEYSCGIVPLRQVGEEISVLLIFHKGGKHWGFPKGHKNPEETDLETAQRELKEETGLDLEVLLSEIPYVESYNFYKFHEKVQKTVAYYPAFVAGDLLLQAEEILDAKWLPLEEAIHCLNFKESKEICRQVVKLLAKSR